MRYNFVFGKFRCVSRQGCMQRARLTLKFLLLNKLFEQQMTQQTISIYGYTTHVIFDGTAPMLHQ